MAYRMIVAVARPEGICSAGIKGNPLVIVSQGADVSRDRNPCNGFNPTPLRLRVIEGIHFG